MPRVGETLEGIVNKVRASSSNAGGVTMGGRGGGGSPARGRFGVTGRRAQVGSHHIGMLVRELFNASISVEDMPVGSVYLEESDCWCGPQRRADAAAG